MNYKTRIDIRIDFVISAKQLLIVKNINNYLYECHLDKDTYYLKKVKLLCPHLKLFYQAETVCRVF